MGSGSRSTQALGNMDFSGCGPTVAAHRLYVTGSGVQHTGLVAPWRVESSGPGIEPVFSALAGGFLPALPPGKSCILLDLIAGILLRTFTSMLMKDIGLFSSVQLLSRVRLFVTP